MASPTESSLIRARAALILASLRCPSGTNDNTCLTDTEVTAARELYAGPVRGQTGKPIYPGWSKSSEAGWGTYLVNPPEPVRFVFWKFWVYNDPGYAVASFKSEEAIAKARQEMPYVEATDTDLRAFQKRSGKLLMYHGWADPVVPPENTIQYYEGVEQRLGGDTGEFPQAIYGAGDVPLWRRPWRHHV